MTPYWVKFATRKSGCVEAESEAAAMKIAHDLTGHEAVSADKLPYPADPRINEHISTYSDGSTGTCPSFCYSPKQCKGRGSCPKRYACSE